MSWRIHIPGFINPNNYHLTDVYEFGVYTGQSMVDIGNIFTKTEYNIRKFFGLDSFQGLPDEKLEPIFQSWKAKEFSGCDRFNAKDVNQCMQLTEYFIRENCKLNTDIELIPGFYENILNEDIITKHDMKPALYVDIDVDLYSSTLTVLDFMFKNKLIQSGTIIGYDDWGGTPGWKFNLNGESRAHKEMCEKYNIQYKKVAQLGQVSPHVAVVFEILQC